MSRFRLRHVLPFLAGLSLIGVLAFTPDLLAQSESLTEVGDASGLGSEDPRIIIANIIRTFLTVLGVLAVLIVLYGGWVWMTAGGNAEKVEKAKKILIRGGIGIAIILMSWAITTFVITALLDSTGGSGGSGDDSDGSGGGVLGGGSTTSFSVTDYSPEGAVSIRNVQLRVTFSKTLDDETVEGNIVVTNASSGEAVDGAITVSGNKATFVPSAACPSPNEDRSCFDADTEFTVTVSEAIESSSGTALTCGADDCTSSFTTGSLVDTEDPVAEITDPERGDGVEAGSVETIQVHATDDTEVSGADFSLDEEEFDSVGAEGDDLSDVTIESTWDTTELTVGQDYEISVTVTDIAGNTDGVSVDVTARGAWCFNDEIDEEYGETGLNCGGDSSSAEYCGACDGSSCTEDSECSSGSCVDGVCTTLPEIESVSPGSGAVGTYVTVSGSGFGTSTGTVAFTSEDGTTTVEADIPSCSDGWSDTEIVVEVPEGAGDGPITVTTDDDLSDATDDDAGALIDDFDVNDTERPKLCSLFPDEGESTDGTTLSGLDFGDEQGSSTVSFGTSAAGSYTSWEDTSASVTVPALEDGEYDVVVTVDGVESNAVTYTVEEDTTGDPVITGIDPSEGAVGDYITISGENFGILVGTVRLVDDAGNEAVAEVDFPEECAEDYWEPTEITVIVPEEYQSGDGLSAGAFDVYVVTQEGAESDTTSFTVEDGDPSPGICAIDPDVGLAGTSVTIYGERLGSDEGSVAFYDEDGDVAATVDEDGWSSDAISLTVPSGAETGPVTVTSSAGDESNSIDFEVSDAGAAETETEPASYGWYFSTGEIPETPELLVECSDDRISGVPNNRFTSDGVCVEAMVYGEFSTVMNEGSITDALTVEMCTAAGEQPCDTTTDVTGDGTLGVSSSTTSTTFSWSPSSTFTADTTYRVTVSTAAMSDEAQALDDDVSWEFTTASSSETCEVDTVHVVPSAATITEQYATEQFTAVPADGCVVVDGDDYTWDWYVYSGVANLTSDDECAGGTTDCTLVEALAEGEADVIAEETASTTSGQADLTVAFTDPYVSDYWPDCDQACSNGEIGASFNTAVTSTSLETDGRVELYECDNELCAVGPADEYGSYDVVATDCDDDDPSLCAGVAISPDAELTPGTYYRAVISRRVETPSGVSLTRTNYDTGFSWVFRVMEGDATCAVERIEVTPVDAVADAIGDRQTFTVDAYGTPDACSVAGQLLSASDYDWSYGAWSDDGSDAAVDVADWWDVGSSSGFVDTSIEDVPEGCTASCIPSGSTALDAVCGDGTVDSDAGEECEDGNTADDDGCSSSCLYEGSETTCGDDVVDTYEECDDGGIADGDGCSSVCLNEGSRAIGTTCGNDDVAYEADQGGEDCDDGNVVNGDGCSSVCLNEGSLTLTDVGGAVCGDLRPTAPAKARTAATGPAATTARSRGRTAKARIATAKNGARIPARTADRPSRTPSPRSAATARPASAK
ncbi:IPT/TIG domain-containing protein [Candidatus Uhrbacteria bacterium]|nr:IPT/TIG domain-containing protein [Candidatus Uhrbacteria bacterium]